MRRKNLETKDKVKVDKRKLFSFIISMVTILMSIFLIVTLSIIDVLPFKYMLGIILGLLLVNTIMCFILLKRKKSKKVRNFINVIQTIVSIVLAIVSVYSIKTYNAIDNMSDDSNTKKENYSVIVLKDSAYNNIKDLKGKMFEYYNSDFDNSDLALKELEKKIDVNSVSSEDVVAIGKDLLESSVDAILIEDSQKVLLGEELEGFEDKTKVIYTFSIDVEVETIAKEAEVTTDSFIVYISGIDTYGKISSVSRSDVNMVAVVNPKTYQVLLINIPRDYYVQLHGTSGKRDKLTHAGMFGVEKSVQTIEDLLDININYYFKVNFTSLEDIVNAIGGIEVYSEYDFTSVMGKYKFKKGYNSMNGHQALCFSRERKAFPTGDRMRGKNQQAVINAMIKKAATPAIITKVDSLLATLSSKFQTNMDTKKMMSLVKLQISKSPEWNVSSISLTGADGKASTYSTGSQLLYVMYPSQNSINDAMDKIKKVIAGERLESSYDEVTGNVYVPTQAEANATPPKKDEIKNEEPKTDVKENPTTIETPTQNEGNNNQTVDPYED